METENRKTDGWQLNKQINLSVLIQLVLLASLIVGSWVNLQRQLDMLQRDISMLIKSNETFQGRLENLHVAGIGFDYRIRSVEKQMARCESSAGILRP